MFDANTKKSLPVNNGLFVAVDGMSKSGKTTTVAKLKERINQEVNNFHKTEGVNYVVTTPIEDFPFDQAIRKMNLLNGPMSMLSRGLLLCSLYHDYISEVIRPSLASGKIVLADGFFLTAHLALYTLDLDVRQRLFDLTFGYDMPDFTLFLEVDPEAIAHRVQQHNNRGNRGYHFPLDIAGHKQMRQAVDTFFPIDGEVDEHIDLGMMAIDGNNGFEEMDNQVENWLRTVFMPRFTDRNNPDAPKTLGDLIKQQMAREEKRDDAPEQT